MITTLAIVADFNPASKSHATTNEALAHSAQALGVEVDSKWIGTDELTHSEGLMQLAEYDAIWVGPCSPYRSMEGALAAIQFARERRIPMLGTCGGFQHLIVEFARNVLGFADANHEESAPGASRLFISRLACSLVGRSMTITFEPDSTLAQIYGRNSAEEEYICNFGVNPEVVDMLRSGGLRIAAGDAEGTVRAVELPEHPFFIGTLFLPQHRSTKENPHPVVSAFINAAKR